jgi:hypothetical protein
LVSEPPRWRSSAVLVAVADALGHPQVSSIAPDAHLAVLFALGLDVDRLATHVPMDTGKPYGSCCAPARN